MSIKRAHVIYSGKVQGVGFRWTAEYIANSLGLTGWVQNCPDGTVEVVCEGKQEDIHNFLDQIKKQLGHYIRLANVEWESAKGEFNTFSIKFFGT